MFKNCLFFVKTSLKANRGQAPTELDFLDFLNKKKQNKKDVASLH